MKRDAQGRIVLSWGFFLKYLWGMNFAIFVLKLTSPVNRSEYRVRYPKDLCSLIWGSVLGTPFFLLLGSFVLFVIIVSFIICGVGLAVFYCVGLLFGYVPKLSGERGLFHPYRRYGREGEEKMPFAPWHVWLPAVLVWLMIRDNFSIPSAIVCAVVSFFGQYPWILAWWTGVFFWSVVVLLGFLFFRSNVWEIVLEFIKAKKKKMCPLIVVERSGENASGSECKTHGSIEHMQSVAGVCPGCGKP